MPGSVDAVVIGAGVIGSAVALELARGGRSVTVVDRGGTPGGGSTAASSSIVRFNYSTHAGVAVSWEARHCWLDWAAHLGHVDPAGLVRYVETGGLVLESPGVSFDRVLELFADVGIPAERLDPDETVRRFPYLDTGRFGPPKRLDDEDFWNDADGRLGAFYTPEGGFIDDPSLAAHNLLHAATAYGATTLFHHDVVEVTRRGDRVTGVVLDDGSRIDAVVVVNVAGPESAGLNRVAGVLGDFRITTRPLRQEVHVLPAPPGYDVDVPSPFLADADLGVYCRPVLGGGLLVGGLEPTCDPLDWVSDPRSFDVHPTAATYEAQVTRLARRLPGLVVPPRPTGLAGLYDVTEDWIPIYDRTALDGFYVAVGTSGNQLKNAPVVGQLMAALIDACEGGHDHDTDPVRWTGPRTGLEVDLGHYSRLREITTESTFSVLA